VRKEFSALLLSFFLLKVNWVKGFKILVLALPTLCDTVTILELQKLADSYYTNKTKFPLVIIEFNLPVTT